MLKEKAGRVTFMPLNRLKPKNPTPPNAQDAIPLLDKLKFAAMHEKAFQQVFGKTCVCRDLTVAAAYVKSHGINTITLDGDKVDRKGALTGGYHDVRRSRIEAIKSVTSWRTKFETEEKRSKEVKSQTLKIDQEVTRIAGRVQVLVNQQNQAKAQRDSIQADAMTLLKEKERLDARVTRLEADVEDLESELRTLSTRLQGYRAEINTPMAAGLSEEEEQLIGELEQEVQTLQKEMVEMSKNKNEVSRFMTLKWKRFKYPTQIGSRKNILQIELNENLRRRREELRAKIEALGIPDDGDATAADDYEARTRELKALNTSIESLTKKVQGKFVTFAKRVAISLLSLNCLLRYGKGMRKFVFRASRIAEQLRKSPEPADRGYSECDEATEKH